MKVEKLSVRIVAEGAKEQPGEVNSQHWTVRERAFRALKILAICWAIAVPTILIPGLHFVLPPIFLIGGVIGAFFKWRETVLITAEVLECPACGAANSLLPSRPEWPLFQRCGSCEAYLRLEKNSAV